MSNPIPDREAQFTVDAGAAARVAADGPQAAVRAPRPRKAIVLIVLALLAGAIGYYFWQRGAPQPLPVATAPPVATPAVPAPASPPAIEHPIEQTPGMAEENAAAQAPLPKLDESDAIAADSIAAILNGRTWLRLLVPQGVIRNIVATVDNLPRKTVATRVLPVKPAPGAFEVTRVGGGMSIAAGNAKRYADLVSAAEAIDTARMVGFYVRLYPLFQQAYVDLGYPNGYFNDRLIAVIDHLLAAPEPKAPVALLQPKVLYQYADAQLEEQSAGSKIMMRVGTDNAARLKAKLREIRKALVADAPKR